MSIYLAAPTVPATLSLSSHGKGFGMGRIPLAQLLWPRIYRRLRKLGRLVSKAMAGSGAYYAERRVP